MKVQVFIAPVSTDTIQVRWQYRLDGQFASVRRAIEEEIDGRPGVERVNVLRYQAFVQIATHFQEIERALADLAWLFSDPESPLLTAPALKFHRSELEFELVGVADRVIARV